MRKPETSFSNCIHSITSKSKSKRRLEDMVAHEPHHGTKDKTRGKKMPSKTPLRKIRTCRPGPHGGVRW